MRSLNHKNPWINTVLWIVIPSIAFDLISNVNWSHVLFMLLGVAFHYVINIDNK